MILTAHQPTYLPWAGLFHKIILADKFVSFNKVQYNTNESTVSVGSSVNWHPFVKEMIKNKIYGFENLSLIPGSVGASPIQNIGAYGQEVSNLIARVDCFDYVKNKFLSLSNSDCNFSYRKSSLKDKPYIIFNIDFNV